MLALQTNGDSKELTLLTNAFVWIRLVYNLVYIIASIPPLAIIRASVFMVGITITFKIFLLSTGDVTSKLINAFN